MPSPDAIDHADIIAGVERALVRLLTAPDTDGAFYDAVRQGTRDAIWAIAAQCTDADIPPAGHAN